MRMHCSYFSFLFIFCGTSVPPLMGFDLCHSTYPRNRMPSCFAILSPEKNTVVIWSGRGELGEEFDFQRIPLEFHFSQIRDQYSGNLMKMNRFSIEYHL